jgi:predicted metal-dependent hydrolase
MPYEPVYPEQRYSSEEIKKSAQGPLHPKARAGIQLFNRGEYFEAHEALELAWREEPGPIREFYRGVLQIGVAYHHILHGNYRGALKMFSRAKKWLVAYPAVCRGVNLAQLKSDAQKVEEKVIELGMENLHRFEKNLLKPILFEGDFE